MTQFQPTEQSIHIAQTELDRLFEQAAHAEEQARRKCAALLDDLESIAPSQPPATDWLTQLRADVDAHAYNLYQSDATEWYALLERLDAMLARSGR